ncbi:hypothetical protein [Brevibacterium renqingii]|uniref:hypothetical protein n=1 Tax=Brevibacterium renqingii TaxID=2776916 RepID=UPI001ADFC643|nr:hypothetical protein [Brevibacterium renqingii]
MSNMSGKKPRTNSLADRIVGFDDPSMGDERERDVILRAYTFGSVISTYALFALGLVFAAIGAGMWSVLIILASGLTGVAVSAYCKRENVDFSMAIARVSPRRLLISNVVGAGFAIAWVAALVFHMTVGRPLIDVSLGSDLSGVTSSSSIAIGAAVGFVGAIVAMSISRSRKIKQARAEAAAAADIEDED